MFHMQMYVSERNEFVRVDGEIMDKEVILIPSDEMEKDYLELTTVVLDDDQDLAIPAPEVIDLTNDEESTNDEVPTNDQRIVVIDDDDDKNERDLKVECPVCLSDNLDAIVKLPECGHEFCLTCISTWLTDKLAEGMARRFERFGRYFEPFEGADNMTCPMCRTRVAMDTYCHVMGHFRQFYGRDITISERSDYSDEEYSGEENMEDYEDNFSLM